LTQRLLNIKYNYNKNGGIMTKGKMIKGFTLIELMVVMALMAVLAVLVLGAVQLARNTATETIHRSNGKAVQTALESSYARNKVYCGGAGQLACDANYSLAKMYYVLGGGLVGDATATSTKELANFGNITNGKCLKTTYWQATPGANSDAAGGGQVRVTATGYAIIIAKSDCSDTTGSGDNILSQSGETAPTW
jgi:prepilin-type N-terminal cleavage/methylation domain-containing protein